jgi:hypothetical protein
MNKNDLVSLCEEGRKMVNFPERPLSDSERNSVQFRVMGEYSKRFPLDEGSDKKEFYRLVLDKWIKSGYAEDFSEVWKGFRTYLEIRTGLGLFFASFSEE